MTRDELSAAAAKIRWFHRIDLGSGVVTAGLDDSARKLATLGMPEDLSGKSVLDVGAWDGFFSFEAERRGARRVLATDSYCWRGGQRGAGTKAGFDFARGALKSEVEELEIDVIELSPERIGTFDLVFFLGVLYHMRHPLLSLERAASVTAPGGMVILETHLALMDVKSPALAFYPGRELNNDPTNWYGPNPAAVEGMLRSAGFREAVLHGMAGRDRGVFHAWKAESD